MRAPIQHTHIYKYNNYIILIPNTTTTTDGYNPLSVASTLFKMDKSGAKQVMALLEIPKGKCIVSMCVSMCICVVCVFVC